MIDRPGKVRDLYDNLPINFTLIVESLDTVIIIVKLIELVKSILLINRLILIS